MVKRGALLFALGLATAVATGWAASRYPVFVAPTPAPASAASPHEHRAAPARRVIFYRDPSGAPVWSSAPRKDDQGRDFLPVFEDEEISFEPKPAAPAAQAGERKILFYRNPMGLPDTSPVPKKDPMGMDYIPVYDGDAAGDDSGIKISLGRVQRAGVRTEPVATHVLVHPVRAIGTVAVDESRLTSVTLRSEGFIEELFANTTGQVVRQGEPLFRVYSPQIQQAQIDLLVTSGAGQRGTAITATEGNMNGAMQRLRNLGVPESLIRDVREKRANPRTIDWPSPVNGTILAKRVINGQRVNPGDELYRIADLSTVWVIADLAESDIAQIAQGTPATVTFRAFPTEPVEGRVSLIYPELKTETRTVRVRIDVANPQGRYRTDMYADVDFRTDGGRAAVPAVPDSAVLDDGTRQIVLVAQAEGRFEPRPVKLGRRSDGYREVLQGLSEGEEIVTSANFLIDAESNLRAALKGFETSPAK